MELSLVRSLRTNPLIKGAKLQPKQKVNMQQATLKAASCQGLEGAFSGASWSHQLASLKQVANSKKLC